MPAISTTPSRKTISSFQSSTAGQHHLTPTPIIVRRISVSMLPTSSSNLCASSSPARGFGAAKRRPLPFPVFDAGEQAGQGPRSLAQQTIRRTRLF